MTLTKEWLQQTIEEMEYDKATFPGDLNEDHGNVLEAFKQALAGMSADKVTLYRERNPYNGMTTGWQELTDQEYDFVKDNAGDNAEFRTVYTAPQLLTGEERAELENYRNDVPEDYFASLVTAARIRADKAMLKFPQPNYVLNKVAEESGEVIKAVIHFTEGREQWENVEAELIDNLAMLIRLVKEGDQVIGFTPPESCRAAMQSGAVKDGWVMVPVEPTAEMISAGIAAHYERTKIQIHDRPAPGPMECAYMAMIAAAPDFRDNSETSTIHSRDHFISLCNQFWNWQEFDEINAGEEEPRLEWDGKEFTHRVTQALWRMYQAAAPQQEAE